MVKDLIEFGNGVTLTKATAADFAILNANLRDEDREECRVFGAEGDDIKYWDAAWGLRFRDAFIGIVGWGKCQGTDESSPLRLFLFMSTTEVERHKIEFVKVSRRVMQAVMDEMPPQVKVVFALPMASYKRSIEWQRRILGFKGEAEVEVNGVKHVLMACERKGV